MALVRRPWDLSTDSVGSARPANGRNRRRNLAVHEDVDEGQVARPFADLHHCGVTKYALAGVLRASWMEVSSFCSPGGISRGAHYRALALRSSWSLALASAIVRHWRLNRIRRARRCGLSNNLGRRRLSAPLRGKDALFEIHV